MIGKRVNPTNLKGMTTFNSYIYSKAAATRILGTEVVNTVPDNKIVWCWLPKGQKAEMVSKIKFKEHFAEYRRQEGKKLSVLPGLDNLYHVSKYRVEVFPDHLSCTCHDWKTQNAIGIKTPCCKHCYSVLYQMGYGKLSEYLEARESSTATNQQDETTSQTSSSLPQLPTVSQWILYWETYGRDRATGEPLKTATTICKNRKPTDLEIWDMRKLAHSKGFKLVSIEQMKQPA